MNQLSPRNLALFCRGIELLELFGSVPSRDGEFFHGERRHKTTSVVNYRRSGGVGPLFRGSGGWRKLSRIVTVIVIQRARVRIHRGFLQQPCPDASSRIILVTQWPPNLPKACVFVPPPAGSSARSIAESRIDAAAQLADRFDSGEDDEADTDDPPAEDIPPAVRAEVLRMAMEKHFAGLADAKLPIFGGRSAREAARNPKLRPAVVSWAKGQWESAARLGRRDGADITD